MKNINYKTIGIVLSLSILVICTTHSTSTTYNNLENQTIDELTNANLFNPQLSSNIKWAANGTIICNKTFNQELPQICSDGSGGVIITWEDLSGGISNSDIYAQRIDSDGNVLWDANGTVICDAIWPQDEAQICSDGAGGAIIAWEDFRKGGNHDIYAQRIDPNGNIKWTINGEEICAEVDRQGEVQICSDGVGGAILIWEDWRSIGRDVYAQRIDSNGDVQWTVDGVAICTANNNQMLPQLTSDGSSGAIITWIDYRSDNYDVYAQRINSNGTVMWGSDVPICTAGDTQDFPQICMTSDRAGGAVISWLDYRNMSATESDIYAQRVHQNGTTMWIVDGEPISVNPGTQLTPRISSDGTGGAIITWVDNRTGNNDIYAQKVDANGNDQWTYDGEVICTENGFQSHPEICSDEHGGAIVTWRDYRNGNSDIYAQWIDSNGIVETINGFPICTEDQAQFFHQICSNGTGGAIIVWQDYRGISDSDIYAQYFLTPKLEEDGETPDGEIAIPFGSFFLFFTFLSVLSLILFKKSRLSLRGNK